MDHSLQGYLNRQSSQLLFSLLADYEKQKDNPLCQHIAAIIQRILEERQKADAL